MIDRKLNYGRHLIEKFSREALQSSKAPVVLDIGAGSGTDLTLVQKSIGRGGEFHAIEAYPPNVELLRELGYKVCPLNLESDNFPYADETFDLIIANQVLEHTKELFWISHEVMRTLKVGGTFLIGVPNLASFHNRGLLLLGRQPTAIQAASAHIRGFTRHDILRFFEKTFPGGTELTHFGGSNFYPFPPFLAKPLACIWPNGAVSIFIALKKKIPYNGSILKFPLDEKLETNYFLGHGTHGDVT